MIQSYLAMAGQWPCGTFQALASSYLSNLPPELVQSIEPFVYFLLSSTGRATAVVGLAGMLELMSRLEDRSGIPEAPTHQFGKAAGCS